MQRLSEDLDFTLLETNQTFDLQKYIKSIDEELSGLGFTVEISLKSKKNKSNNESAFI